MHRRAAAPGSSSKSSKQSQLLRSKRGLTAVLLLETLVLLLVWRSAAGGGHKAPPATMEPYRGTIGGSAGDHGEAHDAPDPLPQHRAMCRAFDRALGDAVEVEADALQKINAAAPSHLDAMDFVRKIRVWPHAAAHREHRILCVTFTFEGKKKAAAQSRRTWGTRCDRHVFITNSSDIAGVDKVDTLLVNQKGGERWSNAWQKTRSAIRTLHEAPWIDEYEFAFFGGDDVMLVVENLRKMIDAPEIRYAHEAGAPLHFGQLSKAPAMPFISGAGYVLNSAALHLMAARLNNTACYPSNQDPFEDVHIAECLTRVGVSATDTRDIHGEDRFTILAPWHHAEITRNWNWIPWWVMYRDRQVPTGLDMMSRDAVVMHYVSPEDLVAFGNHIWSKH
jgi:hypothetical protein